MSILSAVLFIHVLSAMSMFAAFALEAGILLRIRSSLNVEQARAGVLSFHRLRAIAMPAFLGVLGTGLYLAYRYGGGTPWIPASLVAMLLIMLVGGTVTGIKMARLKKPLPTKGEAVAIEAILARTQDRALLISYGFRVGLAVGIVFLMTGKPELGMSVIALAGGALGGVFLAAGFTRMAGRNRASVNEDLTVVREDAR
jgi:hypothetical protein